MLTVRRLLPVLLVLVGCSPARVVDVSWIQYDEGVLSVEGLSEGGIALLPVRAVPQWDSLARPFAAAANRAIPQALPGVPYTRWEQAARRINEAGASEVFAAALDYQRRTGVPNPAATSALGKAVGARYLLVVLLEGEVAPYGQAYLAAQSQIWDSHDGAIVWEGVGASQLQGRDGYVSGSEFPRVAAEGLARILPGAVEPKASKDPRS